MNRLSMTTGILSFLVALQGAAGQTVWHSAPTSGVYFSTSLMLRAPIDGREQMVFMGFGGTSFIQAWDGASWTSLPSAPMTSLNAWAVHDDGEGPTIYAVGMANSYARVAQYAEAGWQEIAGNYFIGGYPGGPPPRIWYQMPHLTRPMAVVLFDDGSGPSVYVAGSGGRDGYTSLYRMRTGALPLAVGGPITGGASSQAPLISSMVVFDDGTGPAIYAAGEFESAGGAPATNLARFNGQSWEAVGTQPFVPTPFEFGARPQLRVLNDGSGPALYIENMRWDGHEWMDVGRGSPQFPLAEYMSARGEPALYSITSAAVERLRNGSWEIVAPGISGAHLSARVKDTEIFDAGEGPLLIVQGEFEEAGNMPAPTVATLRTFICPANCDESTAAPILTVDDFTCFINEFAQAQSLPHEAQVNHYANCNGSTSAPVLTVDDFTCFVNAFAQGCP